MHAHMHRKAHHTPTAHKHRKKERREGRKLESGVMVYVCVGGIPQGVIVLLKVIRFRKAARWVGTIAGERKETGVNRKVGGLGFQARLVKHIPTFMERHADDSAYTRPWTFCLIASPTIDKHYNPRQDIGSLRTVALLSTLGAFCLLSSVGLSWGLNALTLGQDQNMYNVNFWPNVYYK